MSHEHNSVGTPNIICIRFDLFILYSTMLIICRGEVLNTPFIHLITWTVATTPTTKKNIVWFHRLKFLYSTCYPQKHARRIWYDGESSLPEIVPPPELTVNTIDRYIFSSSIFNFFSHHLYFCFFLNSYFVLFLY